MLVSLQWLKELVHIPAATEELTEKLTDSGSEIEGVERPGEHLSDIVIGEIKAIDSHASRDALKVADVDCGGEGVFRCVTGAPNAAVGQRVPFALPGGRLADGTVIGEREFDGVLSSGMALSAGELGIPEAETEFGLLELPDNAPVGKDCISWLNLDDTVLDVAITPNRGDLLSMQGMAREVAGIIPGAELREQPLPGLGDEEWPVSFDGLVIEDSGCLLYTLGLAEGITIAPSPLPQRIRLARSGIRPINNVVDVTNLVMLHWGQPLHAFDLDRLPAGDIGVRSAAEGERLVTLDGKERLLEEGDLCITSGGTSIGLAGVMGGEDTEVTGETKRIALESAVFAYDKVGRTSRRLGLGSEAAFRFARGVARTKTMPALAQALQLFREQAGARTDYRPLVSGEPAEPERTVSLRRSVLQRMLMQDDLERAAAILSGLGFAETGRSDEKRTFTVPAARLDVHIEEDLVEEVARVEGYDKVPSRIPPQLYRPGTTGDMVSVTRRLRETCMGRGYLEIVTYSFVAPQDVEALGFPDDDVRGRPLPVANPISQDQSVMRTQLLPGLLKALSRNLRSGIRGPLRLFETGNVFHRTGNGHCEPVRIGGILSPGRAQLALYGQEDFLSVKGDVLSLFEAVGLRPRFEQAREPFGHAGQTAHIYIGDRLIGYLATVKSAPADRMGINRPVYAFELDLEHLAGRSEVHFGSDLRYPPVYRDIAIMVPRKAGARELAEMIAELAGEWAGHIQLFDTYEGAGIPEGAKSLAFSIAYRHPERTLNDEEVEVVHQHVREELAQRGYQLR